MHGAQQPEQLREAARCGARQDEVGKAVPIVCGDREKTAAALWHFSAVPTASNNVGYRASLNRATSRRVGLLVTSARPSSTQGCRVFNGNAVAGLL
jgi:hypothetical protein